DGRPNVAKDGSAGRDRAEADTLAASRRLASLGIAALVIDTAPSPHPFSSTFAAALGARYVALPRAGAAAMARAVSAALPE
ncbi:hypothetical protein, partial [Enterococcus faecium]|uniref:hypothetical protein n=1 Tax=Enterococcus faecium TaxID=1352 RepID=UPI003F4325EB